MENGLHVLPTFRVHGRDRSSGSAFAGDGRTRLAGVLQRYGKPRACGAPTVTAGANGAPAWIVRATGTLSADYVNRASLYLRESFADPCTMTVVATRGFLGAGGAYDIAVPDLSAASGFTFFWNFHRSTGVAWTVTGGEGDPGGPNEASCMLSGVCTVKAIDGATYKSAQAIGTVTVP